MQMLKKLFNSDKKYYLELDEIKDSDVVQTAVKTAGKAADVVKDKASEVANSQPVQNAVETATEAAGVAQDKIASVINTDEQPGDTKSTKTEQVSAKTTSKQDKESKSEAKTKNKTTAKAKQNGKAVQGPANKSSNKEAQPQQQNSGASSYDPPFWVAAMYKNNGSAANSNGQEAEQTFAPDHLMPIVTRYRRRPGGSLSKFKNMAKQARTPKG